MRDVCIFVFCLLLLTLPGFGIKVICNSVQLLSRCVRHFVTLWTAAHQASWSITNSQNLLKLTSIESVMASNHLILCGPLLFLPSVFSSIRVFSSESVLCITWAKYWSFSLASVLLMNIQDWFPLGLTSLILQSRGLSSLLQHCSSKASILWCSTFLYGPTVTFIHDYWKNHSFDWMDFCR